MTDWQPTTEQAAWTPPPTPETAQPRTGRWLVAVAVSLAVGVGGGFLIGHTTASHGKAVPPKPAATRVAAAGIHVAGTMTLTDATGYENDGGGTCSGTSGYDDIASGAEVVISTDAGHTLAITQLQDGQVTDSGCEFAFAADVPGTYAFYGVTVSHRGTVKFSKSELGIGPRLSLGD